MTQPRLTLFSGETPAVAHQRSHVSLTELLALAHAQRAALPAYRFLGRSFTFEQVDTGARSLAAWWVSQGIKRGDRVAVMLPNVPQYPVAVAAILRAGAVVVNVNPQLSGRDLEFQLKDSGAKGLVLFEHAAAAVQAVLPRLPQLHPRKLILASMGDMLGPLRGSLVNYVERNTRHAVPPFELPQAIRFNDALSQGQALPLSAAPPQPDDLAVLQYSGGGSAQPRAAVLLHRNLVANVEQLATWLAPTLSTSIGPGEQARVFCGEALHTPFGFNLGTLLAPLLGLCCVLSPQTGDAAGIVKELGTETLNGLWASPSLFEQLLQQPVACPWTGLRLCLSVGGSVSDATATGWQRWAGHALGELYGLAEAGPFVAGRLPDTAAQPRQGLQPLPGTDVLLLDADDRPLPTGTVGELTVRGPQVMAGYWQRPDETARVTTVQGSLRTGDLAKADALGGLRIIDGPDRRTPAMGVTCLPPMTSKMRWA